MESPPSRLSSDSGSVTGSRSPQSRARPGPQGRRRQGGRRARRSGYAQVVDKKGKAVKTGVPRPSGSTSTRAAVQESLTVKRGKAPGGSDAGRHRRRHRAQGRARRRRPDQVLLKGPAPNGDDHRAGRPGRRRQLRRRQPGGVRPAHCAAGTSACPAREPRSRSRPSRASPRRSSSKRVSEVLPKGVEAITAKAATRRGEQGHQERTRVLQHRSCWPSASSPVRRRLPDLQHLLDAGRAAHA